MKAYYIEDCSDSDKGAVIGFGKTAREVKKNYIGREPFDDTSFVDLRVTRYSTFDGCEDLTRAQIALKEWREGWWFEQDFPSCEHSTDQEFLEKYYEYWPDEKKDSKKIQKA